MGRFDDMEKRFEENDKEGGQFFKLDDGQSALVAFLGEPLIRETYWDGTTYQDWTPGCGHPKTLKTKMNVAVFTLEGGKPVLQGVQILEQGKNFFKDVMKLDKKYGIDNKVFEITRDGTGTDTKYTLLPECDIDAALRKQLAALELHDLSKDAKDTSGQGGGKGSGKESKPDTVISTADGDPLVESLRALSAYKAEILTEFLQHFGIRKIRELTTSQLADARAWVETELEGMKHSTQDADGDPFE